jgi:hypothetical protein
MVIRGDCLACVHLGECTKTSAEKVIKGYTCPTFFPAPEAVYLARWDMMKQYGEASAAQAMVLRETTEEEGDTK